MSISTAQEREKIPLIPLIPAEAITIIRPLTLPHIEFSSSQSAGETTRILPPIHIEFSSSQSAERTTFTADSIYLVRDNRTIKAVLWTAYRCTEIATCLICLATVTLSTCLCLMFLSVTVLPSLDTYMIGGIGICAIGVMGLAVCCFCGSSIVGRCVKIQLS